MMFRSILVRSKLVRKYFSTNVVDPLDSLKDGGKLNIPEAPKSSMLDSFINLIRHDKALKFHEYVDANHKMLGPIYRERLGSISAVFLSSPEGYQKVFRKEGRTPMHFLPESWLLYNEMRKCPRGLLFMEGEEWLHYRKILNKLLLVPYSAKEVVTKSCEDAAISLSQEWEIYAKNGDVIPNVEKRLYRWSIEVMMATLLGSAWPYYKKNIARGEAEKLAEILHKIFELSARLSFLPAKYAMKLGLPVWREFVQVVDEVLAMVRKLVPEMAELEGDGLLNLMKQEGIANQDLVKIVTDLILAAGDTTAYSTQWILFLLSTHPSVQEKFATRVRSLEMEQLMGDSYLRGILKEGLRLYPTAPFLTRILPEDSIISGYLVPKGNLIIMSLYSSGRDEQNFPKSNEFKPDRWLRNEKGGYDGVFNAFGSIPFALGVRSCVGKKIAETQMTFTLAQLVKSFIIECKNASRVGMKLHLISVPSEKIEFLLKQRKN